MSPFILKPVLHIRLHKPTEELPIGSPPGSIPKHHQRVAKKYPFSLRISITSQSFILYTLIQMHESMRWHRIYNDHRLWIWSLPFVLEMMTNNETCTWANSRTMIAHNASNKLLLHLSMVSSCNSIDDEQYNTEWEIYCIR